MSQQVFVELFNFFVRPENEQFKKMWEASGWKSHAEAGRKLELSRSMVGKVLVDKATPSASTLKLFKLMLLQEKPSALSAVVIKEGDEMQLSDWEREVLSRIRNLHREDRERVLGAIKAFVSGLPEREPTSYQPKNFSSSRARSASTSPPVAANVKGLQYMKPPPEDERTE